MARIPSYQTTAAALPLSPSSENGISQGNRNPPISYPQVLDPEHGPQTVHRPDLYFASTSPPRSARQNSEFMRRSSNAASASPISQQLYPYHQQAFHHYAPPVSQPPQGMYPQYQPPPPIYPQYQAGGFNGSPPLPPALPPKPIVYPTISATAKYDFYSSPQSPAFEPQPPPLPPPLPPPAEEEELVASPIDDSNELAMALALSQSESVERQKLQEELQHQEEEDLARALAESLRTTGSNPNVEVMPFLAPMDNQRPSSFNAANGTPRIVPSPVSAAPVYLPPELPAHAPVYLPSEHSPVPNNPSSSPPTRNAPEFPEFGRHDKWRIPGMPDTSYNGSSERPSGGNLDRFGRNPSVKSSSSASHSPPRAETSRRSSSVSSVSSLPYTRTPLGSSPLDNDDESQRDIHDEPNDRYEPSESSAYTSPDVNSTDSHPAPSWVTSQPANLYTDSEEPNILEFDDEAYARQLAAEEEAMAAQEQQYGNEKSRPIPVYQQDAEAPLPLYTPADQPTHYNGGTSFSQQPHALPRHSVSTSNVPYFQSHPSHGPEYGQPAFNNAQPRTGDKLDLRLISSLTNVARTSQFSPVVYPTLSNHHEAEADSLSDVSHHSSVQSTSAPPAIQSANQPPTTSSHNDIRPPGAAPPAPAIGMLNANHFLDRELLLGVSIGFKAPAISRTLIPMQDPMPNIISLPYARCPPLHLQAPDWRHLLRLMARLSGTRIEPTVEAMAVSKTELKLRTVVQFIKPHPSVNEWRIILWFTIDHPIPPSVPGASRYSSGNPNLLPWSYTLSPVPMLLRDAADTHISKTYTIPATESVPLPNLPVTFPNLALYLQAALDASRRQSNDSSGMGKLGKVVQMCYPAVEQSSEFDIPERTKMTDMFKRVMKRGNKDKKKGKTTNNEETYQLVTPFVPDEWG